MKLDQGILFGALIIAVGLSFLLYKSGQPPVISVLCGVGVGVLDYIILYWMKSKGIGK